VIFIRGTLGWGFLRKFEGNVSVFDNLKDVGQKQVVKTNKTVQIKEKTVYKSQVGRRRTQCPHAGFNYDSSQDKILKT
jgi:hypothetical protein